VSCGMLLSEFVSGRGIKGDGALMPLEVRTPLRF
jgi:hypothetical protein